MRLQKHLLLLCRWKNFEDKWMTWLLMKPSARKNRDHVFNVFHQLNLKDAMSYVAEVRNHTLRERLVVWFKCTLKGVKDVLSSRCGAGRAQGISGVHPQ